jgi:hypothetical protein
MFKKTLMLLCATVLTLASQIGTGAELVLDFRSEKTGELPRGFLPALAGAGAPGEWKIVEAVGPSLFAPLLPTAPRGGTQGVLAQLSTDPADERFPMLIYTNDIFGDFSLTTKFKLVSGEKEQMAGIAFRIQDEKNFYYVRASALGGTFNFFKIVNGVRSDPIGIKTVIAKDAWHEMIVECKGTSIRAVLDGRAAIPTLDDKSFTSGSIGFWTKSDSVSYFADTLIRYKPRETLAQLLVKDAFKKYSRLEQLKIFAPINGPEDIKIVASLDAKEVGQSAPGEAAEVLAKRGYFYGKSDGTVALTLPLHDNNGDKVAAVRLVMKSFVGQTENNALARALPVVKSMEARIQTLKDLLQ